MAQAFVTTYKNDYRGIILPRVPICREFDMTECIPDSDRALWIRPEAEIYTAEGLANAYEKVKELVARRNITTYQISYCGYKDLFKAGDDQEGGIENQLLLNCKKTYGKKPDRLLPPLQRSRKMFGYLRRSALMVPLTTYQRDYGKLGCSILEKKDIGKM